MKINDNLVELTNEELKTIDGGILPFLLAGVTIIGAWYGAGYAVGVGIKNYENSK